MQRIACTLLLMSSLVGCADAARIEPPTGGAVSHTVSFVGFVYDGVSGKRVTSYTIAHQVLGIPTGGTVGSDGRFEVGTISAFDDFTIIITAEGSRPFLSHNASVGLPPEFSQSDGIAQTSSHQTLHFDAYVFPTSLQAPASTLTIKTGIADEMPSGSIRLRPIAASVLADEASEMPGGVPGQVWSNDEDLQANTLSLQFSGGQLALSAGDLVYGVAYRVNIYDVAGYQPFQGTYTAGVEASKTFTLTEEVGEPVTVVSTTATACMTAASPSLQSAAEVTVEFNQNVELHDTGYPGGAKEALDDGLSITSPNTDMDGNTNQLNQDTGDTVQERGTSLQINGNVMTLSWSPLSGLLDKDPDDPILQVTYGGLGNIALRRINAPGSATALSTLLGQSSITCN